MPKGIKNPSKYLGNELEYIKKVLSSENWSATGGNCNTPLKKTFAKNFGVKYGFDFNNENNK